MSLTKYKKIDERKVLILIFQKMQPEYDQYRMQKFYIQKYYIIFSAILVCKINKTQKDSYNGLKCSLFVEKKTNMFFHYPLKILLYSKIW